MLELVEMFGKRFRLSGQACVMHGAGLARREGRSGEVSERGVRTDPRRSSAPLLLAELAR